MKLLLKQESELRSSTRSELVRQPTAELEDIFELKHRGAFLTAQIKHSFHITEQLVNALSEQLLVIQAHRKEIKRMSDELEYLQSFTVSRLDEIRDDVISAYQSDISKKPQI